MKNFGFFLLVVIGCYGKLYAQDTMKEFVYYANQFQEHKETSVDSAVYFAHKLAVPGATTLLTELLHNNFAQAFITLRKPDTIKWGSDPKRLQSLRILTKMLSLNNTILTRSLNPIYLWTKAQENQDNIKELRKTIAQFNKTEFSSVRTYSNRSERYALLIYEITSRHKELFRESDALFSSIVDRLERNQVKDDLSTAKRPVLAERAWYRYLFAYSNYLQANRWHKNNDAEKEKKHLQMAFKYSPDLIDRNNSASYFYDMLFMFVDEKPSFQDDYLNFLVSQDSNHEETLTTLLSIAIEHPQFKPNLKRYYEKKVAQTGFDTYWKDSLNARLPAAPAFILPKLDGKDFSFTELSDKWILLDFWGTWCTPCLKEMPALEKFNKELLSDQVKNLAILTIACRDSLENVQKFVKKNGYTFPVAMADKAVESAFKIKGYPSKILITPDRKYLIIPFGENWIEFIKAHLGT
jgi:thiol-disulfide isomerase/thioredoxin